MRTVEQIKKEIEDLEKFCTTDNITKRQLSTAANRIENLRACILYVGTNPSETFMNKQLTQLKKNVDIIKFRLQSMAKKQP